MMRTQVWFDGKAKKQQKVTEMTWQEIFEEGLDYRMYLLKIGDKDALALQKERKDKRLKKLKARKG